MIGLRVPPRHNSPGDIYLRFTNRANVNLPHQITLSQPIALRLVIPNIKPAITRARGHLTRAENVSGLEIIRMYNQYAFGRFGIISASWPLAC